MRTGKKEKLEGDREGSSFKALAAQTQVGNQRGNCSRHRDTHRKRYHRHRLSRSCYPNIGLANLQTVLAPATTSVCPSASGSLVSNGQWPMLHASSLQPTASSLQPPASCPVPMPMASRCSFCATDSTGLWNISCFRHLKHIL